MAGHHYSTFTTVRNEGALLPSDFLQRVAKYDPKLAGLTPAAYHRHTQQQLNEAVSNSWHSLLETWTRFKTALTHNPVYDKTGTNIIQKDWLQQIFQELHYGELSRAQPSEIDGKRYTISHHWNHIPIHLVNFKVKLDDRLERVSGKTGVIHYSPHKLVQDWINYAGQYPWGIVSNGLSLRLLHKNMYMTRQSYLEFDLEAMMQGEIYSDFVLFWLLCHQSRLEDHRPEECWLEKWSRSAQEEGVRLHSRQSTHVESAITALGRGFLNCHQNQSLHEKLRTGVLSNQDYYRQLLRLVYRLIVLFVAEDREVLFLPNASEQARKRYTNYYSTTRLRRLADLSTGTPHIDLFRGVRLIMDLLGQPDGCPELGLSALNGFLFSKEAIPDLETCDVSNNDFLDVIRELAFTADKKNIRQRVNYKHIGSEELGSIYERLLELHPVLNIEAKTFELQEVKGNERKTTGTYYTPPSLVHCLLDSALEPIIQEAYTKPHVEQALLDLKVCDPACGSGHFLVGAAHRIAAHLAIARAKEEEPTFQEQRQALRDVVSHCIYGVDINPMAVELCKVSLWMESIEPGKPLSFLDHHILCGNSLIGTTPALLQKGIPDTAFEPIEGDDKKLCREYKKLNRKLQEGNRTLFDPEGQPWEYSGHLTHNMMKLADMSDKTVEGYHHKKEAYQRIKKSDSYLSNRLLADMWCAAFVWKKTQEFSSLITDEIFWKLQKKQYEVKPWMRDEIVRLQKQYQFFHWHLEFADVFPEPVNGEQVENEKAGWNGGFDVVLGNPPWERIDLKEQEWFATNDVDIAESVGTERKKKIGELAIKNPCLHNEFLDALRVGDSWSHFMRHSGRYPLSGHGRINTYATFAETMQHIVALAGQVGCIIPSGIATDETTKYFFQNLTETQSLVSLYDFENRDGIFSSVHRNYKFCLLTLTGTARPTMYGSEFAFFLHSTEDLKENKRRFTLSANDLALMNPNTHTCPVFRSRRDAELTKSVYQHVPVPIHHLSDEEEVADWNILFDLDRFNMTSDSHHFHTREQLANENWIYEDNIFHKPSKEEEINLPLYEGKMISHFDHRFHGYESQERMNAEDSMTYHKNPLALLIPRYWVSRSHLSTTLNYKPKALIAFRDIARAVDLRTVISTILPVYPCGDTLHTIVLHEGNSNRLAYLNSCLSSFVFDYVARQKLNGTHVKPSNLKQLPILPLKQYCLYCQWNNEIKVGEWMFPRVLELNYTAWDLEPFAKDCGYNGPPFKWDEERRFLLRCELDAAYFHLYGIKRDDVDYIMETFPIAKDKDEKRYGTYRTKKTILAIYDAMGIAIKAGRPYRTLLAPPPADLSVAHPPRS